MRATEELIDRVLNSAQIPAERRRRDIERELRSHIEEFTAAARERGLSQEDIEQQALAHFGEPSQISRCFSWVYRYERRRLRVLAFTLSTVLIASCLSVAVLVAQAGLAFGFGIPIMHVLASPHTVIEALDIVASVAAYLGVTMLESLFEAWRFQKAALLLTMILTTLIATCAAMGWHISFVLYGLVNAVFFRTVQLYVSPRLARIAIVVVCFSVAGLVSALRWQVSHIALAATCASWLAMGIGYQFMTELATRVDAALLNSLDRIQEGY